MRRLVVLAAAVALGGGSAARADVTPGYLLQDSTVAEGDTVVRVPVLLTSPAPSTGVELSYTELDGTATSVVGGLSKSSLS